MEASFCKRVLLSALLVFSDLAGVEAPAVSDRAQQSRCSVKVTAVRKIESAAAAAGIRHLAGLDTCRRADGGGALVTTHFQLAESSKLLAELHERLPPHNDPAGVLAPLGGCADLVAQHDCSGGAIPASVQERMQGITLAQLCPASCPMLENDAATDTAAAADLLRSPLTQPALGCSKGPSTTPTCPRAVVVSLPTGGPIRSYLLRVYAAPNASDGASLPMVAELSLAVAPVPWGKRDQAEDEDSTERTVAQLPRHSALLPTPFAGFAEHNAVVTTPLRRHLRIGNRYNFEVVLGGAEAVALVPAQAVQETARKRQYSRWVHLAPAENETPETGIIRWRGSAVVRAVGGLMLMAQFGSSNYDALVRFEATDDGRLVNGSTGVDFNHAWHTPVRIMPSPAFMGDLGVSPLSHPYSEIFLDGPHMTMKLATKRPVRLRVHTSSEEQEMLRGISKPDDEGHLCKAAESAESSSNWEGAVWEQPRVLITHNEANTEHTIYVHWDHPDTPPTSDRTRDISISGARLLKIYAADLATADDSTQLDRGWPQILEYFVWVAPSMPSAVATTGATILRGIASSLGGWLSGSATDSSPRSFVPLKRESAGAALDPLSVQRHLRSLPTNTTDTVESLVQHFLSSHFFLQKVRSWRRKSWYS